MFRRIGLTCGLIALVIVTTLTWRAWAGPIVPSRPELSDAVRSLADIKQLHIVLQPLPSELTRVGVDQTQINAGIRQQLAAQQIEVVEDETVPGLDCRIIAVTEPKLPDAVAYSVTLLVFQSTHVKRLGEDMELSTYAMNTIGLEPRSNIRVAVEQAITDITRQFLQRLQQANDDRMMPAEESQ